MSFFSNDPFPMSGLTIAEAHGIKQNCYVSNAIYPRKVEMLNAKSPLFKGQKIAPLNLADTSNFIRTPPPMPKKRKTHQVGSKPNSQQETHVAPYQMHNQDTAHSSISFCYTSRASLSICPSTRQSCRLITARRKSHFVVIVYLYRILRLRLLGFIPTQLILSLGATLTMSSSQSA